MKPSHQGGLTDGTKAEVRFKDRAMFEFVSLLEKTRERWIYMRRRQVEDEDALRMSIALWRKDSGLIAVWNSNLHPWWRIVESFYFFENAQRQPTGLQQLKILILYARTITLRSRNWMYND